MKKYESIAESLKENIMNGTYPNGNTLPTEEQLVSLYNVSRQTIRNALSLLVEQKLIVKHQGSGSVVSHGNRQVKTGTIAVVATYISDYIFPSQLRAVEEVISKNKYSASIAATRNRVCNERMILKDILKHPVDGILIEGTKSALPNPNFDLYKQLLDQNIPIVFFNGYYPSLEGTYYVCADNYAGGYTLVKHLLEKGHTKIAGYFKSDDIQGHQRYSGFISALFENGVIIPDENVTWYTTKSKCKLCKDPAKVVEDLGDATAVVCYNDEIALELVKCLTAAGKSIPKDIAVVSFDNSPLSNNSPVSITSLSYEDRNIGRIAAHKLIKLINGETVTSEIVPWTFIQKESS